MGFFSRIGLEKKGIVFFAVALAVILLFFKPVISGDGFGYYAITEGIGKFHSVNLENGQRFFQAAGLNYVSFNEKTGLWVSKYALGMPLLDLPLYSLGLFFSGFVHVKDAFFLEQTQDVLLPQLGVCITSLFFLALAFAFSAKILRSFFNEKRPALIVLLAFLGTPLVFFSTYGLSYSHAVEAGLFSLLVFLALLPEGKKRPLITGALAGLLFLVRYPLGIFLLPILAQQFLKKDFKGIAKTIAGFLPFVIVFLAYNFLQFGNFTGGYESFDSILPIHFFQILLDLQRGILLWSPLLVLGIAGLFFLKSGKKWLLLSFAGLLFWVYGAWPSWDSGWSFGNRFFIVLFPLACVGIHALLERFNNAKYAVAALAVYGFAMFLLFITQTSYNPFPEGFLSTIQFWQGKDLGFFVSELFRKIGIVRLVGGF